MPKSDPTPKREAIIDSYHAILHAKINLERVNALGVITIPKTMLGQIQKKIMLLRKLQNMK